MSTNINKSPVYKITGFSDIIASPVFYSILFLALILGLSSIFGFLQNPRKLKAVVDVIHQKVSVSGSNSRNKYSLIQSLDRMQMERDTVEPITISYLDKNRYSIFSNSLDLVSMTDSAVQTKVSFDYDITSKEFWGTFDNIKAASRLDDELNKLDILLPGVPLDDKYTVEQGDEKYSLGASGIYPISL